MLDESKINVDKNLLQHIKENVFPRYEKFYSHDMRHIERVIETITMLARYFNLDENMAFTIASYHDVGLSIDRKHHEITSGQALANDEKLREFFTEEQIETMREAVEDHRGSRVERPRNIMGKFCRMPIGILTSKLWRGEPWPLQSRNLRVLLSKSISKNAVVFWKNAKARSVFGRNALS